jgi:crotonobetainyl-CoA:carnitine CoA-transferase CaiB-like acyl-CoA transferase
MLADFGADVIKVERAGSGDSLRAMGPQRDGKGVWWTVTGRNKRSVCIDLKSPDGRQLVRDLVAAGDVVVENFRPGVLERLGLGYEALSAVKPDLIMLRVSGFGQSGPYSGRGGFGKIAEAFSGAAPHRSRRRASGAPRLLAG